MGLARTTLDLDKVRSQSGSLFSSLAVDYMNVAALTAVIDLGPFDAALIYAPGANAAASRILRTAVTGRVVEVLGSQAASGHPDAPFLMEQIDARYPDRWNSLILGWTIAKKWHSPEEISEAALSTLQLGRDRQLGMLRPWADRPKHN